LGGAENVLDQLAIAFPDAPIACLWNDAPDRYRGRALTESPLARTPLRKHKAASVPFQPLIWAGDWYTRSDPDWIVSISHSFAHQIGASRATRKAQTFTYVCTPARYLWAREDDPRGMHPIARAISPALRVIDTKRSAGSDHIAVLTHFVKERVCKAWGRDSTVIYPPVDVEGLLSISDWRDRVTDPLEIMFLEALSEPFILGASRMVKYKRLDSVIKVGDALGLPVVVAGDGPERSHLEQLASEARVPVSFPGRVSDALLRALMQRALVYVFPPVEDFGIMPVEAMILGTPVVVNSVGGAKESVGALGFGESTDADSICSLTSATIRASSLGYSMVVSLRALSLFGNQRFRCDISRWVKGQL